MGRKTGEYWVGVKKLTGAGAEMEQDSSSLSAPGPAIFFRGKSRSGELESDK